MVYKANDYKNMLQRREKELKDDCECGCNTWADRFENIAIGLLVGFIIGLGVVLL